MDPRASDAGKAHPTRPDEKPPLNDEHSLWYDEAGLWSICVFDEGVCPHNPHVSPWFALLGLVAIGFVVSLDSNLSLVVSLSLGIGALAMLGAISWLLAKHRQ